MRGTCYHQHCYYVLALTLVLVLVLAHILVRTELLRQHIYDWSLRIEHVLP